MIGIIYKFSVIAGLRFNNKKPFYIGQHWDKNVESFLSRKNRYWGSGKIWWDFISKLKKNYPDNWKNFIRREVLFASEHISQTGLDAMEEFYIKRENAHYSCNLGGCNTLRGACARYYGEVWNKNKHYSIEHRKKLSIAHKGIQAGKRHPLYGKKHSEESKRKMSESRKKIGGIKHSKAWNERISISHMGDKNPMYGKKLTKEHRDKISKVFKGGIVVTNGIVDKYLRPGQEIPNGFYRGRKRTWLHQLK